MSLDIDPITDEQDGLLWSVQWIAAYYQRSASTAALYTGLPRERRVSPQVTLRMLEQIGIGASWVKRDLSEFFSYLFPVVLARRDGGACIVTERKGKGSSASYTVLLPETNGGAVTMTHGELAETYSGAALLCSPKPRLDDRDADCLPEANKEGHWLYSTLWRLPALLFQRGVSGAAGQRAHAGVYLLHHERLRPGCTDPCLCDALVAGRRRDYRHHFRVYFPAGEGLSV
ncbi:type I secretion system ATPase [Leminorella grimontii]|nr:type I secretion system ATPase [Leminorella grimontii]